MREYRFISDRLRFRNRVVTVTVAVSYLVMIVAVAVSSGFRGEIRSGLSRMSGDIQITPPNQSVLDVSKPIEKSPFYISKVEATDGVKDVVPVVYRAGIVKAGQTIHGVMFKGLPEGAEELASASDSVALAVAIPRRLSEITGLKTDDKMMSYFIGEKTRLRQFNIVSMYDAMVQPDDMLVVYTRLADLQRLEGWTDEQVSSIEIHLDDKVWDDHRVEELTDEVSGLIYEYSRTSESPVIAESSRTRYSQIFDWLDLIDFNVFFIFVLMTLVAGFNMMSGMLIMLFENRATIGVFKALGMRNRSIFRVFLTKASGFLLKSMLIGNVVALAFCLIQDQTHILGLNPENYFVSFVPVSVDIAAILVADVISYLAIMLILLLSIFFISKVDPAQTVKMK